MCSNFYMGGSLTYETDGYQKRYNNKNPENARTINNAGDFPDCKGLYPDCPENPSLDERMCRSCPKTDGLKKKD